jgi:hypothetical protein
VATNGNDADAGTKAKPFATLQRARDEIRRRKPGAGATVFVRGGLYWLPQGIVFELQDSGTKECPIVYRAFESEKPVLIGGRAIGRFTAHKGTILKADVGSQGFKGIRFRQLFFDGKRQIPARYPNFDAADPWMGGWTYVDGKPKPAIWGVDGPEDSKRTFPFKRSESRSWAHPQDGWVLISPKHEWDYELRPIASVDTAARTIALAADCSYTIRPTDPYVVMGLFEELDAPGEWYLDPRSETLYFWPPNPLRDQPVYAPTTDRVIQLREVSHVTLLGFTIECAEQSAVDLNGATDCGVFGCTVRNVGSKAGIAIRVHRGANIVIEGCDVYDVGASGISLEGGDAKSRKPGGNRAENNHVFNVGTIHRTIATIGIAAGGCGNRISRNTIHHTAASAAGFSGTDHIIELNHMHHTSLGIADNGVIHPGSLDLLTGHGCVIRHNFMHDPVGVSRDRLAGKWLSPHYTWGVYLDWCPLGMTVEGNIIARCPRAGIHVHDGRHNRIENNIVVDCALSQIELNGWTTATPFWSRKVDGWVEQWRSVADHPAWKNTRSMQDPRTVPLPDGRTMRDNVFVRNVYVYRNSESFLLKYRNLDLAHNLTDYNLVWHYNQPMKTGFVTAKRAFGGELAPNSGFEDDATEAVPAGWRWGNRPAADATALVTDELAHCGTKALRIRLPTAPDASKQSPWERSATIQSVNLPMKPGASYAMKCWLRADRERSQVNVMVDENLAPGYFRAFQEDLVAGPQWREQEFVFQFPQQHKHGERSQGTFYVRIGLREPTGTLWMDDLTIRECEPGDGWSAWQSRGGDQHSVVADPLFVDSAKDDYRLKPESPAFQLGFKPIPVETIGVYQSPHRASWPVSEYESEIKEGRR